MNFSEFITNVAAIVTICLGIAALIEFLRKSRSKQSDNNPHATFDKLTHSFQREDQLQAVAPERTSDISRAIPQKTQMREAYTAVMNAVEMRIPEEEEKAAFAKALTIFNDLVDTDPNVSENDIVIALALAKNIADTAWQKDSTNITLRRAAKSVTVGLLYYVAELVNPKEKKITVSFPQASQIREAYTSVMEAIQERVPEEELREAFTKALTVVNTLARTVPEFNGDQTAIALSLTNNIAAAALKNDPTNTTLRREGRSVTVGLLRYAAEFFDPPMNYQTLKSNTEHS